MLLKKIKAKVCLKKADYVILGGLRCETFKNLNSIPNLRKHVQAASEAAVRSRVCLITEATPISWLWPGRIAAAE